MRLPPAIASPRQCFCVYPTRTFRDSYPLFTSPVVPGVTSPPPLRVCPQVCINGKPTVNSVPNTIFCDDNIEVQQGVWQQVTIDVNNRMQLVISAKNLTTSVIPGTDLPGNDYSVTTVTYDGASIASMWYPVVLLLHVSTPAFFTCSCIPGVPCPFPPHVVLLLPSIPISTACPPDPFLCKNACDATTTCLAWSFTNRTSTATRTCYLKTGVSTKTNCASGYTCTCGIKNEPLLLKVQVGSYAKGTTTDVYVDNMVYAQVNNLPSSCPYIQLVSQLVSRKVGWNLVA
jgi:hypothetical protein